MLQYFHHSIGNNRSFLTWEIKEEMAKQDIKKKKKE